MDTCSEEEQFVGKEGTYTCTKTIGMPLWSWSNDLRYGFLQSILMSITTIHRSFNILESKLDGR